jgi:hypothetical protein
VRRVGRRRGQDGVRRARVSLGKGVAALEFTPVLVKFLNWSSLVYVQTVGGRLTSPI